MAKFKVELHFPVKEYEVEAGSEEQAIEIAGENLYQEYEENKSAFISVEEIN